MIKRFLLCLLMIGSAHAEPFEDWTNEEKAWFAASEITQAIDYQTTRNMLYQQSRKGFYETNPLLGHHPSKSKMNLSEVATLVGNYYLSDYLGHDNRLLWLKVHTSLELLVIGHNLSIGAELKF